MRQKSHPQQHHHHHPVLAEPSSVLGPASTDGDSCGSVDNSLRPPQTAGVRFATPEEDDADERNKDNGRCLDGQKLPPSPSRRQMTAGAALSATTGGELTQTNGAGVIPAGARDQQPRQQLSAPLGRPHSARNVDGVVSRRRPRQGALTTLGVSACKSPPPPLGRGSSGPLGGYRIQQGGPYRGGDDANLFLGGGGLAGGGRGGSGLGAPQVRMSEQGSHTATLRFSRTFTVLTSQNNSTVSAPSEHNPSGSCSSTKPTRETILRRT